MSGYQAILEDGNNAIWDSIRDSKESALFKVCEYLSRTDIQSANTIRNALIFGTPVDEVSVEGYRISFKYIP